MVGQAPVSDCFVQSLARAEYAVAIRGTCGSVWGAAT